MIYESAGTTTLERRRSRTRRLLLDAAFQLVAQGGLDGLTINGLARAVDYTPGALYRYFDSRDALIIELEREVIEAWQECIHSVGVRCDAVALEPRAKALLGVLAIADLFRALAVVQPTRFALASFILGDPRALVADEVARTIVTPLLALVGQVAQAFATADELGALRPGDPARAAVMLLTSLIGVLQTRKLERLSPEALRNEPISRDLVRVLLRGMGAEPAPLHTAEQALAQLVAQAPLVKGASS